MSYNFDPERWYDNERLAIDSDFRAGKINTREYREALDDLDERYDSMLDRLDGTYQIPAERRVDRDNPG